MGRAVIGLRAWLAIPAVLIGLLASQRAPELPTVQGLVGQLEGGPFRFRAEGDRCSLRREAAFPASLVSWLMEGGDDLTSRADAARCLGQLGPAARPAVPALLRALDSAPGDRDTGHGYAGVGIISVRSAVIEALGRIGDGRALGPLAEVLATQPAHARVSLEALQALGPQASGQAGLITAVLEARIADRAGRAQACRRAVLALDERLAREAVVQRLERQHPERTRHVFQDADVAAALRTLDRRSPDYLKQREGVCRDPVAEAALRALAAIRCATCLPPIVSALREPWLASAAAWELGRIRPLPPAAVPALRAVIASPSHGPLARESARTALLDSG
ncbi:HEAT repeat domain-containing protein [Cyanobium sp. FGCU-6]|nr:HEAT repeat domain-containing protein [Cyanobium sp. FGCU6]